jgi:hypothetical protein
MVCLNTDIPINYIHFIKNIPDEITEEIKDIIDIEKLSDKDMNIILKKINSYIKKLFSNDYFIYLLISSKHCVHKYKRGKKDGTYCCSKIEIDDKNFLCSRHNRKYTPNSRIYTINNPRCTFIRSNDSQCKHKCSKYNSYCYIHIKDMELYKKSQIEKLKILRKKFINNKYNYRKIDKTKNKIILKFIEKSKYSKYINKYDLNKYIYKNSILNNISNNIYINT